MRDKYPDRRAALAYGCLNFFGPLFLPDLSYRGEFISMFCSECVNLFSARTGSVPSPTADFLFFTLLTNVGLWSHVLGTLAPGFYVRHRPWILGAFDALLMVVINPRYTRRLHLTPSRAGARWFQSAGILAITVIMFPTRSRASVAARCVRGSHWAGTCSRVAPQVVPMEPAGSSSLTWQRSIHTTTRRMATS